MAQANTEFTVYVAAAWIFVGAIVLILLRPLTWRRWLAGLAAGAAWLITWYAPVSTRIGGSIGGFGSLGLGRCIPQACLRKSRLKHSHFES